MKKYKILYVDPPWKFNNKNTGGNMKSGADSHYPTMSINELSKLDISSLCDDDCVLFMWWVASQPAEALELVESWGFTLKTMTGFNWVKQTSKGNPFFGMGFWTRQGSEMCLIATKGKPKRIDAGVRSVIMAENEKHSKKPDIFRKEIVKLMGDLPRVELFARETSEGWDVWGNEVESDIEITNGTER